MMDLTGRPPVRRRTSGVLSIDAHGLRSGGRKLDIGPADARDPNDSLILSDHGPGYTQGSWHAHLLKTANHQAPSSATQRLQFVSGTPWPHQQGFGRKPRSQTGSFLVLWCHCRSPAKAPGAPNCFPMAPFKCQEIRPDAGRAAGEAKATEGELGDPLATQWCACTACSDLQQPNNSAQPSRTKLASRSTSNRQNEGVGKG